MGRTATHVANRYGYTIYAKCDAERERLVEYSSSSGMGAGSGGATFNLSGSNSAKFAVNLINAGFAKILPGNFVKFDVDCRGTKTVYISIYAFVNDRVENICVNIPKREDYSVIVEQSGQVVDAKYGTIWTRK